MSPVVRSEGPNQGPAVHIALRLPARAEYVALCRSLVATVGEMCRLDPSTILDLKLAVTEACGNAVRHAYPADAEPSPRASVAQEMEMECHLGDARVAITIRDWGRGVDRAEAAGDSHGAGFGFHLLGVLTEDVAVAKGTGGVGTTVTFTTPAG